MKTLFLIVTISIFFFGCNCPKKSITEIRQELLDLKGQSIRLKPLLVKGDNQFVENNVSFEFNYTSFVEDNSLKFKIYYKIEELQNDKSRVEGVQTVTLYQGTEAKKIVWVQSLNFQSNGGVNKYGEEEVSVGQPILRGARRKFSPNADDMYAIVEFGQIPIKIEYLK